MHPRSIVQIAITAIPASPAKFGHRHALLSEEGGSEADGWCLGIRTVARGRGNTLSHFVTAPSGREPLVSADFGHRIVGRDDSARRGRNCNGCNLHYRKRVHINNLNK